VRNVCIKLGAEGDPCYENIECVDQLCSAGRCALYDLNVLASFKEAEGESAATEP
jgi:hypothetical protein